MAIVITAIPVANLFKIDLDEWELFDFESDPQEMHCVYGDPKYAQPQAAMLAELQRLRTKLEVTSNDPPQG